MTMKKKLWLLACLTLALPAFAQDNDTPNPKDLWVHSIDVKVDSVWKTKTIRVPGKKTPNVVDFFRAVANTYPCDYHRLLLMAIDGDREVKFNHKEPYIKIDKDSCFLENASFAMRVFYTNGRPAALGVCFLKALTTKHQDAYYYRFNAATRTLTPLAKGSDFTGGIIKRQTIFSPQKDENRATMTHRWGRCGIESLLNWKNGRFVMEDAHERINRMHYDPSDMPGVITLRGDGNQALALLDEIVSRHDMELRMPKPERKDLNGGSIYSLPICVALRDTTTDSFASAEAMEGFYYFYVRSWKRPNGTMLLAAYTECAPKEDVEFSREGERKLTRSRHRLGEGDEVSLLFFDCDKEGRCRYLAPGSAPYLKSVGKGLPRLDRNEWRAELSADSADLVFINESDGRTLTFKWDGTRLR